MTLQEATKACCAPLDTPTSMAPAGAVPCGVYAIDLFHQHMVDPGVPIEDVGAAAIELLTPRGSLAD